MIYFLQKKYWATWYCEIFDKDTWRIPDYCEKKSCGNCSIMKLKKDVLYQNEKLNNVMSLTEGTFIVLIKEQHD